MEIRGGLTGGGSGAGRRGDPPQQAWLLLCAPSGLPEKCRHLLMSVVFLQWSWKCDLPCGLSSWYEIRN